MTTDQTIIFGILAVALALFVWGRWRYDLVAVLALLAVVLAGLVPSEEAFAGFAHPAVVTVAAVLVISRALQNGGAVDLAAGLLAPLKGRPQLQLAGQTAIIAVLSAVMNNVGAMALMLPVALQNAYREGYPPAKTLMPLAFGSLLGGLTTMIGTPPNIIIATFREQAIGEPFRMFDFTAVGGAVALAGIAFIITVGWRLVPLERKGMADPKQLFEIANYVAEARVPEGAKAIGRTVRQLEEMGEEPVIIAGLVRSKMRRLVPSAREVVRQGDILILEGEPDDITGLVEGAGLELQLSDGGTAELTSEDVDIVEAVVRPDSPLIGRTARAARLRRRHAMNLLAVARQGRRLGARPGEARLRSGDVLLLQAEKANVQDGLSELGLLPLAERDVQLGRQRQLALSMGIFAAAVAISLLGLLPIYIAFLLAVVMLVLTGVIRLDDTYRAIDWPVIVLLAAMIPVGSALEATGATALVADAMVEATAGFGAVWVLLALLVATMVLSDLVNNNATAVLMAPIAIGIADRIEASPDPFLMAVAVGASCAFLTPIGHQSNTLVMEPGGYRFGDYWRMGLPLEAVIAAVAIPMIYWIWPPY
jgi:di/tricarboxylate transporter